MTFPGGASAVDPTAGLLYLVVQSVTSLNCTLLGAASALLPSPCPARLTRPPPGLTATGALKVNTPLDMGCALP